MFRWPWVSRARYEDYIERHLAFYSRSVAQYDQLLEKYHALTVQGSTAPALTPMPEPVVAREPSMIAQVIREQSGGDPRLAAHLRTYAGKLKRDGNSEEEIAFALGQWVTTEPQTI